MKPSELTYLSLPLAALQTAGADQAAPSKGDTVTFLAEATVVRIHEGRATVAVDIANGESLLDAGDDSEPRTEEEILGLARRADAEEAGS